jgi:hypothetical protein
VQTLRNSTPDASKLQHETNSLLDAQKLQQMKSTPDAPNVSTNTNSTLDALGSISN